MIVAGALTANFGCVSPCGNEFVSAHASPDGRLKAVVFVRSCGATTPFVTEMSVLPADAGLPQDSANALIISDNPDRPIQRSAPAIEVRVKWDSNSHLNVLFPLAAAVYKHVERVGAVSIEYGTY